MNKEEFIKKAKELGLSIDEIDQFIRNQEIAKNYGINDEYTTVNFTIDKSLAEEEETPHNKQHECHCHHNNCNDECCCNCQHDHECNCEHCKHN